MHKVKHRHAAELMLANEQVYDVETFSQSEANIKSTVSKKISPKPTTNQIMN